MKTRTVFGLSTLIVVSLGFVGRAAAQSTQTEADLTGVDSETWTRFVGEQMASSLASPFESIRQTALHHVVVLARYYEGEVDLDVTLSPLVEIYRSDSLAQNRLAAVAALDAIGDPDALLQVCRMVVTEPDSRVQLASIGALVNHFGYDILADNDEIGVLAKALLQREPEVHQIRRDDIFVYIEK